MGFCSVLDVMITVDGRVPFSRIFGNILLFFVLIKDIFLPCG